MVADLIARISQDDRLNASGSGSRDNMAPIGDMETGTSKVLLITDPTEVRAAAAHEREPGSDTEAP